MLDVGQGHTMYYETHGNPKGKPLVVLHGGPGGGLTRLVLKLFNLKKWHVILYDQRGCGKSTPRLELKNNTTWELVEDMELLRKHLHLNKWALYGGSWGTTLALAYASKYLKNVSAFLMRGICLFTDEENQWMFEKGYASEVFPDAWANVTKPLPKGTRKIIKPYHTLLMKKQTRKKAARAWTQYESTLAHMEARPFVPNPKSDEESAVLEAHYFLNNGWITPKLLLDTAKKVKVPVLLVHGKYDMVCPLSSAETLYESIPHAKYIVVPDAGHAMSERGIFKTLQKEIDSLHRKL